MREARSLRRLQGAIVTLGIALCVGAANCALATELTPSRYSIAPGDSVRVHYTGWTVDGRMFDSSVIKGEPAEFNLRGVIAGWTEGIPLMSVGDRFRFWIPDHLAYKGQPDRPQGMLVFDVELIEIKPPAASPDNPHGGHGH